MKAAIRSMMCVVVAATATAALADQRSEAQDPPASAYEQLGTATKGSATATVKSVGDDEHAGGGRGEVPGRSEATPDRAGDDARARDDAAVQEYNHRRFVEQVWTGP